ncbi:MAG: hypothetical protein AB1631_29895 [Acidobacteriota bacterium]
MNGFAPCPKCQSDAAEKVGFTWWGGLIGPRLLNHVKCNRCGATYNGKTGQSNTTGIIIYTVVLLAIAIALGILISTS